MPYQLRSFLGSCFFIYFHVNCKIRPISYNSIIIRYSTEFLRTSTVKAMMFEFEKMMLRRCLSNKWLYVGTYVRPFFNLERHQVNQAKAWEIRPYANPTSLEPVLESRLTPDITNHPKKTDNEKKPPWRKNTHAAYRRFMLPPPQCDHGAFQRR